MAAIVAAFLLGVVAPPPSDDDDDHPRAAAAAPAPDPDDAPKKPQAGAANDDDQPKSAAPSKSQEPEAHDDDEDEGRVQPNSTIIVTARRLDTARTQIDTALGSTSYTLTNETIENRAGGETGSVSDILAQAPGVTRSGKTIDVRVSPANQVRINDVIVPEAISDPADHLSSRLAETTNLITGTLPAQFGFAPAGVISVTTKNGLYAHGGQAEFFAGSDGMLEPAFEWAGSDAATSLFASGSFEHGRSTVADADGLGALDRRNELEGLGFADHIIGGSDRISMIICRSRSRSGHRPSDCKPNSYGCLCARRVEGRALANVQLRRSAGVAAGLRIGSADRTPNKPRLGIKKWIGRSCRLRALRFGDPGR